MEGGSDIRNAVGDYQAARGLRVRDHDLLAVRRDVKSLDEEVGLGWNQERTHSTAHYFGLVLNPPQYSQFVNQDLAESFFEFL